MSVVLLLPMAKLWLSYLHILESRICCSVAKHSDLVTSPVTSRRCLEKRISSAVPAPTFMIVLVYWVMKRPHALVEGLFNEPVS